MIRLSMMCVPQGIGMLRFNILSGSIWTSDCGKYHEYSLELADDRHVTGRFEKTFSAHRNPFRILARIYEDIND